MLSAFALAQPLFNLLSENPEFFAARGSTASDIIVFGVLLVLVPPAILLAIELLVGLASDAARSAVHLVFVGGLAAVVFVQALKKAFDAGDAVLIVLALALGAIAALLYARAEPVRSFLSVLSPAPLLFLDPVPVLLGVSKIVLPEDASAKSAEGVQRVPGRDDRLRRVPGHLAAGRRRDDRRQALPLLRAPRRQGHLLQERPLGLRLHQPGGARDHGRQTCR